MLAPRTRLGPYEIDSAVGHGGMGDVYQAIDTRLGRTVAIKVLAPALAGDAQARDRFEREARAISHISHPHICTLYDIGEESGVSYLVMELLEGETLAQRLERGPLPLDQAITFAIQIADALDKAHRAGIVHGDLKPANVMLTRSGVKLLDFGLAMQRPPAPATVAPDMAATSTHAVSHPGTVLGTLHYLAPEQLEGRDADPRTDVFAFGALLYEMITGRRAFDGHTPAGVIAAVMQHEPPPVSSVRAGTPASIDHVIATCLAKDPDERWQHAGDLMRELRWVSSAAASATATAPVAPRRRWWMWVAVAALATAAALAVAAWALLTRRPPDLFAARTSVLLPEGLRFPGGGAIGGVSRFALSPDGRQLAIVATDATGNQMLWLRPLDSMKASAISGTDGASSPFWSPDSRTIAFVAQGQLKTVARDGTAPVVVAPTAANTTGAWSRDDLILFTPTVTSPLYSVAASGGTPQPVTVLDKRAGDVLHRNPIFLPDGRHFLFVAAGARGGSTIGPRAVYVGSLDKGEASRLLIDGGTNVRYGSGHVIFVRENVLLAQPFDTSRLALTGEPRPVAEQVELTGPGSAAFSVSDSGVLAYQPSSEGSQLAWFDRAGRQTGGVGDPAGYDDVEISPDGRQAAVSVLDATANTRDLWIFDVERGVRTRFTSDPADDVAPIWSPDGERLAFASNRKGHFDIYEKTATGLSPESVVFADATEKYPTSWLRDRGDLLVWSFDLATSATALSVFARGQIARPDPFLRSPASPGRLSPDGRWVAYSSPESGRSEVYVVPFPTPSRKWQVSTAGGTLPRWRSDGRELFYAGRDNRLMAVSVEPSGRELQFGTPRALFEIRRVGQRSFYDVTRDGMRFLVNAVRGESATPSITIVQNWASALAP